ncbi:MAG: TetR/AcrR family transcriptional regulator [Deltaproteobacteria bacterium]|nr:TetR/AcrR family transcriptional regulator [Deltaproteobacteria bacterium]MBW2397595.1 TetR/AcrR family transcriptional regulator [Deltaproteobacteria bacterium]
MARKRPEGRLAALAEAALSQFSQRGYRRAQVADVAAELGLSPGTVYGSVASKEALFDLAVRAAFDERLPESDGPVAEPPLEALVERVNRLMRDRMQTPEIVRAVKRQRAPADVRGELETLVREQYDLVARNRRAIRLLDRCAADWPALAELYHRGARGGLNRRWERYLARRIETGALPPVPDTAIAGRLVIETIAWFAMHRHGDPNPQPMDDAKVRETVVTMLLRGFGV